MTTKMGIIVLGMALLSGCSSPDTSDDSSSNSSTSSSTSSTSYSGSCYDAGGGICGYYTNMSSSEYSNVSSQCVEWYDSQNVCDGNTELNHRTSDQLNGIDQYSYTQICSLDTSSSDSHFDVYNYGLTYVIAEWSQDTCYSKGGSSTIHSY